MSTPVLATKLYIPRPRPKTVARPRLIERLNEGLHRKLTLISASAGFGKTTLVSAWVAGCQRPVAWLSLDEGDNDPNRFLTYLVAALQTVAVGVGEGVLRALQSPQPPSNEVILTALINDITALPNNFVLVLDDYHVVDAKPIDDALAFLIERLPAPMHLVIATRQDPPLPLARLRAQGQLTELRAADLRFTPAEAADFLNPVMGLNLTSADIAALETRTEGWIAGLQLAGISMQGHTDATSFIKSFTGSHRFVLDYLVEEVLQQQPANIQTFLLRTSILNRLCGPLCDAILRDPSTSGQATLAYIERANLFIVPLDNERHWYRYHHLFADLLRQRLHQSDAAATAEYHIRASAWYEDNGLEIEAFHHAVAAHDVERAARLIEGKGMPLHFRGAVAPVLNWLASLPATTLDARPMLWVIYASALLFTGKNIGIEQKLEAAEAALQKTKMDDMHRDLIGHIASIRATLAIAQNQADVIVTQSRRALDYLHPDNLPVRTATTWTLGYAYQLQGDFAAARQAHTEAIAISQAIGHAIIHIAATIGLGQIEEAENQLALAAATYQRAVALAGDPPMLVVCEAHLGLARIFYEWNDLDAAEQHSQHCIQVARQIEMISTFAACEVLLARLKLARGDGAGALALLAQAEQFTRQHHFDALLPEIAAVQVRALLQQGNLAAAAHLAQMHEIPISLARVYLTQGDPSAALAVLGTGASKQLKGMVLQALALDANGDKNKAVQVLADALALAEAGGFIRIFVDEGLAMAQLLSEASARGVMPDYVRKLLAVFEAEAQTSTGTPSLSKSQPPTETLIEPLSPRELEVLQLIAQGLSNREIGERLFLALSTVKGHNLKVFGKLHVQSRTEALARARALGLL